MGARGAKRKQPTNAPAGVRPDPPPGLDDTALHAWHSLCDDLAAQGTLRATDRALIEIYARTWSLWRRAVDELDKGADGDPKATNRPLTNVSMNLSHKLHRLLLDFGLSPATRKADGPAGDSKWGDLIGGPGGL